MNGWRWFAIAPIVALTVTVVLLASWLGIAADYAMLWAQDGDQ